MVFKTGNKVKYLGRKNGVKTWTKVVKKIVKRELDKNEEDKYFDTPNAAITPTIGLATDWSGFIKPLNQIAQSALSSGRIGDMLNGKSIDMRWAYSMNQSSSIKSLSTRFMVVCDMLGQGVIPAITDILQTVGNSEAPYTHLEHKSFGRFKVLLDKTVALNEGGPRTMTFRKFIKIPVRCKKAYYTNTGNAASDTYKNQLYALAVSDQNPASVNDIPNTSFTCRYVYEDA